MSQKALIIIDIQNDYFPDGKFPLWNTDVILNNILAAIASAEANAIPVILVQHVADAKKGIAPFFNEGSEGVKIHPAILSAASNAEVVTKSFADSFFNTTLEKTLDRLNARELLICGMMTQNCVTHTAISKSAEQYSIKVLTDCCTTVSQMIHLIALNALSTRVTLLESTQALNESPRIQG